MAKYFLTNKAVEDLSGIWNYTYNVWSENQADKYYELLIETFEEIAENSAVGKNYNEVALELLGFHIGKHIIFYRLIKSGEVELIRILHERMDLKSRIEE